MGTILFAIDKCTYILYDSMWLYTFINVIRFSVITPNKFDSSRNFYVWACNLVLVQELEVEQWLILKLCFKSDLTELQLATKLIQKYAYDFSIQTHQFSQYCGMKNWAMWALFTNDISLILLGNNYLNIIPKIF